MTDKDYIKAVGQYIASVRMAKGLSQTECGEKAKISRSTMSDIEKGVRLPSGKDVLALCQVLALTPNDIFSYGEPEVFNQVKLPTEQFAEDLALLAQSVYSFYKLSRSSKKSLHDVMYKMALGEHGQEFAKMHSDIRKDLIAYLTHEETAKHMLSGFNYIRSLHDEEPLDYLDIDSMASVVINSLMDGDLINVFSKLEKKP